MERDPVDIIPKLGGVLICCFGAMGTVFAAPPLTKTLPAGSDYRAMAAKHAAMSAGPGASGASVESHAASHLDLRPPTSGEGTWTAAKVISEAKSIDLERYPLLHRSNRTEDTTFPAMGTEVDQSRLIGRAQVFAERFRHEGLPVARLWENHAALVSLGLSPKGKPGLWLVQKTH